MVKREHAMKRITAGYDRANRAAAEIILADPKYTGLAREWAELVMERAKPTITGPLFQGRAA
jgi:hypothetical protein